MHWLSKKRYIIGLTLPALLVYCIYIILPVVMAAGYSFTKYSGIGRAVFHGLKNYKRLFSDDTFWTALKNTLIIFGMAFILLLVVAFFVAVLLNHHWKFTDVSKSLIFSPAIIAPIIVGIIWVYILDTRVGILNAFLEAIGRPEWKQQWLGGNTLSPYSIAVIYTWQQLGYLVTIYIAGLKMISGDIIDAVQIDGAGPIQKLRYITIPLMKPTISTVAVLLITGIFKIFEIVQQTTGGGPNHVSETLVTYSYATTFASSEYGYGMSLATITFLVSLIITGLYLSIFRDRPDEEIVVRQRRKGVRA